MTFGAVGFVSRHLIIGFTLFLHTYRPLFLTLYPTLHYSCGMQTKATSYRLREDVHDKLRVLAFVADNSQGRMISELVRKEYDFLRMQMGEDPDRLREIERHVLGHELLT